MSQRFSKFLFLLLCFAVFGQALGQAVPIESVMKILTPKRQEYEAKLETRARDILSSQLEAGSYFISVSAQLDSKKIATKVNGISTASRFKSVSRKLTANDIAEQFAASLSAEDLLGYILNVRVNLRLDKHTEPAIEKVIVSTLTESLNIDVGRGDKLNLERVDFGNIGSKKKVDELKQELERTKDEKRVLELKGSGSESQKLALESQKLQYEGQLRAVQNDLSRERDAHSETKNQVEELKKQIGELDEKTLFGKVRKAVRGIELLITFLPIAVVTLLVFAVLTFLFISAQGKRSKTMLDGMQIVASALGKSGGGGLGAGSSKPIQMQMGRDDGPRRAENDAPQALTESGLDAARRDAEASWAASQQSPYSVLALMKEMLYTPEGASQFMAISRAIGTEGARLLWAKFPPEEIENLANSSATAVSPAVAFQLVSQVCSQAEAIRFSKPAWFQKWDLSSLVRVSDERFAKAATTMPDMAVSTALFCMPNPRVARVLSMMPAQKRKLVFAQLTKVQGLDEATVQQHLGDVMGAIDQMKDAPLDSANMVSSVYLLADASLKRDISEVVDKDANLSAKLKGIIVTLRDVLSIEKNTLAELVMSLKIEELASFVSSIKQDEQSVIASVLPQKTMLEVQYELARINASPASKKKAEITGERVQSLLIEEVKALVAEGSVVLEAPALKGRAS